jgi:hypothetical protein
MSMCILAYKHTYIHTCLYFLSILSLSVSYTCVHSVKRFMNVQPFVGSSIVCMYVCTYVCMDKGPDQSMYTYTCIESNNKSEEMDCLLRRISSTGSFFLLFFNPNQIVRVPIHSAYTKTKIIIKALFLKTTVNRENRRKW